jgi:hypothetical protein
MMRNIKYHLALTDNEYSLIIKSLNDLRNNLIAQGRYTDAVDDVLMKFIGAKKKKIKIIYQED